MDLLLAEDDRDRTFESEVPRRPPSGSLGLSVDGCAGSLGELPSAGAICPSDADQARAAPRVRPRGRGRARAGPFAPSLDAWARTGGAADHAPAGVSPAPAAAGSDRGRR